MVRECKRPRRRARILSSVVGCFGGRVGRELLFHVLIRDLREDGVVTRGQRGWVNEVGRDGTLIVERLIPIVLIPRRISPIIILLPSPWILPFPFPAMGAMSLISILSLLQVARMIDHVLLFIGTAACRFYLRENRSRPTG